MLAESEVIEAISGEVGPEQMAVINGWLSRGDGVAIYRNQELGHPELGHMQFVSYGSSEAQLETDDPPVQLPDIGSAINWRYRLVGTYRGDPIAPL